ncbi:hypothetical protein ES703_31806 [subsurface metagenome]
MRNLNLKVALVIYGAIHITQGIILLVVPDRVTEFSGFEVLASSEYFLAILGGTFIAAGVLLAITGLNPLQNINGVRFAVLWAGLLLIIPLFALGREYVDFGDIMFIVIENAIFVAAFLIFYPYRR